MVPYHWYGTWYIILVILLLQLRHVWYENVKLRSSLLFLLSFRFGVHVGQELREKSSLVGLQVLDVAPSFGVGAGDGFAVGRHVFKVGLSFFRSRAM